jgi:hypothetical protein
MYAVMSKKPTAKPNRVQIAIKLPPDLLELIDEARGTFPVPVTRTWMIEHATALFCADLVRKTKGTRK